MLRSPEKTIFRPRFQNIYVFFQTSVSLTRETTFWVIGPLLGNPFPKILSKSTEGLSKIDVSEFIPGFPGFRGFRQSGVAKRAPEPTFKARRGSG